MVRELSLVVFYLAEPYSDDCNIFTGVVWLVAVIVGSPMLHVQRLEVDWELGLRIVLLKYFSTPLNYCFLPSRANLYGLIYFIGGLSSRIK
jgi:hypothetical protein